MDGGGTSTRWGVNGMEKWASTKWDVNWTEVGRKVERTIRQVRDVDKEWSFDVARI